MGQAAHILIVEDEAAIRAGLEDVFIYHGYQVTSAADGPSGLALQKRNRYDLILLDVMLPGIDGFELCARIRAEDADQAIIMLTARSSDDDLIQGLSLGADDYVTKPFSVAELVLRVQAVLRRTSGTPSTTNRLTLGEMTIDCANLEGTRSGQTVRFTRREMDVLQYLARAEERAVSREELLHKVWGYSPELAIETRTVDIHIAKLRRKLEPLPQQPEFLVTVRGAGYRLLTGETST